MMSTTSINLQKPTPYAALPKQASFNRPSASSSDTFTPSQVKFAGRAEEAAALIREILDEILEKTRNDKLQWEYTGFPEFILPAINPADRSGYRFFQSVTPIDKGDQIAQVFAYHTDDTKFSPTLYLLPADWQRSKAEPIAIIGVPPQVKEALIKLID